jgi:hypothetical protein
MDAAGGANYAQQMQQAARAEYVAIYSVQLQQSVLKSVHNIQQ